MTPEVSGLLGLIGGAALGSVVWRTALQRAARARAAEREARFQREHANAQQRASLLLKEVATLLEDCRSHNLHSLERVPERIAALSRAFAFSEADVFTHLAVLDSIAGAQRETIGLFALTHTLTESLHLEATGDALLTHTQALVPCAACVLFLPEDDGEYLRAHAAHGVNARHLLGSLARVGAYFTGRAFSRGEMVSATFLHHDLILRDVSDPWTPFRSTLIMPLMAGEDCVGTLNLYAEEPDAFGPQAQRLVRLIAAQASRVLDNARRFAAVQETAYTDAMTGLRNARYLREFLEREVNRANRERTPLAVLNIDLDNFKPINDRFGHARGDQTLREVAAILNNHIRNYDLAARYAGDEFVVVLSRAGRLPAEAVANKLRQAVERHGLELAAREPGFPQLGISIGIALYPDDASDLQGLLCRSDAAMYSDKQSRRGQETGRRE